MIDVYIFCGVRGCAVLSERSSGHFLFQLTTDIKVLLGFAFRRAFYQHAKTWSVVRVLQVLCVPLDIIGVDGNES